MDFRKPPILVGETLQLRVGTILHYQGLRLDAMIKRGNWKALEDGDRARNGSPVAVDPPYEIPHFESLVGLMASLCIFIYIYT